MRPAPLVVAGLGVAVITFCWSGLSRRHSAFVRKALADPCVVNVATG